ncbi:MAG: alpha/beta fold hydrolase [Chloroflexota bacterium]
MELRPFTIQVSDDVLADLRERLSRVRWPDEAPGDGWAYGTDLAYLQQLVAYWRDTYDWRANEALLNAFHHYTVPLAGIDLHLIHEPGVGPNPLPLLLSHGWPGSVWEFHKLIPLLTDPARFGGDPADAFTVVAPSLPGYGFSFTPNQPRFGVPQIAEVFAELMTSVLGYDRFAAHGGDWGSFITARLGHAFPQHLYGIHLTMLPIRRDLPKPDQPTEEDERYLAELGEFLREEAGYQWIQGTKPQTLAYGLTDSPVGLAAWIVEKFRAWSDCDGDPERVFTRDELLTNVMLYWVTGAIGSSFWPYYARLHEGWPLPDGAYVGVPTAYLAFPREIYRPPRSWAERTFNVQRWTPASRGGHFAALEQPETLACDLRDFFRPFRQR